MHPSDEPPPGDRAPRPPTASAGAWAGWAQALAVAVLTFAAMGAVGALGLWAAGAGDLPAGAFPAVLAATVLSALGVPLDVDAGAGFLGGGTAVVEAIPLSVALVGALVAGAAFLRPLRLRAVLTPREAGARVLRTALPWTALLLLLGALARHSFTLSTGSPQADLIGGVLGLTPTVGFHAGWGAVLGYGLLWPAVVLLLAFAVVHRAPLPAPVLALRPVVRPAAHAAAVVALVYTALGLIAGVVAMAVDSNPRATAAVLLLGLPNLAWMGLGIGLGGAWHGGLQGALALPFPKPLASVLTVSQGRQATVDITALAQQDARAWLLVPLAAVVLLAAAVLMVRRHALPAPAWQHALRLAAALGCAMLLIGLLTRVDAALGLSLLGIGDLGGQVGAVSLHCDLPLTVGVAVLWGGVAGFLGALFAGRFLPDRAAG
ncbi:streptophobe family protein [Kitasatospora sp. NBC_01287]|uniref:streptophobe family protein n=1 Tax=Kitasatospora sp. NBC_01287 TaxID=2903573 RepID=UPI002251BE2A|nr:streptophobe family protein [Kitasatospora sp. NBC_01287]MCX4744035.1 streptophobe family protein [Kitasatospora sp. NBC_01287]